ncbi:MAG: hypothetical protein BWY19_00141 [bacterium ADurb.Bin212]|nr:MAG: hypothetical protein BWY19_00141 [bacterium ADurb.Bin212]
MSKKEKFLAVLCYLWVLILIPIFVPRKSSNLNSHLYSGIVLLFLWSLVVFVLKIPFVGVLLGVLLIIACLVFSVWGIIDAAKGREAKIPGVEKISEILK